MNSTYINYTTQTFKFVDIDGRFKFMGNLNLKGTVEVYFIKGCSPQSIAAAVSEFIGWHSLNIYPTLEEFAGYDSLHYVFTSVEVINYNPTLPVL